MNQQDDWRSALERVRRTMTASGRASGGYFSIEGTRLHERALRAGRRVELAVLSETLFAQQRPRIQTLLYDLLLAGCRLVPVPDRVMADLTNGRDLGAIIGILPKPDPPPLPTVIAGQGGKLPVLLVAADVKDPGNVGALTRTALAAGASALIACGVSDPYHPKAVRTSMGSLFRLPVLEYESTLEALAHLAELHIQAVGLAVDGPVALPDAEFSDQGIALVAGSEETGLAPEVRQAADFLVHIPMREGVDSFSVNAAAAIALYEIGRRHWKPAGKADLSR